MLHTREFAVRNWVPIVPLSSGATFIVPNFTSPNLRYDTYNVGVQFSTTLTNLTLVGMSQLLSNSSQTLYFSLWDAAGTTRLWSGNITGSGNVTISLSYPIAANTNYWAVWGGGAMGNGWYGNNAVDGIIPWTGSGITLSSTAYSNTVGAFPTTVYNAIFWGPNLTFQLPPPPTAPAQAQVLS